MEILYVLIPVTLALVGLGIALFMWAVRNGQMDDLERPGHSILYDDDEDMIPDDAKVPPSGPKSAPAKKHPMDETGETSGAAPDPRGSGGGQDGRDNRSR